MKERRFGGLTLEQLNAAGAAAGSDALSKAHRAGLPSPGMTIIRLASGGEIKALTRLHPNGTLEILDDRLVISEVPAQETHFNVGTTDITARWPDTVRTFQKTIDKATEGEAISQLKEQLRKPSIRKTKVAGG